MNNLKFIISGICASALIAVLFTSPVHADVDFTELRGSDTETGITARAVSLGGALSSVEGDLSAVFYNPAGLTGFKSDTVFLSAETFSGIGSAGYIFRPELENLELTIGVSFINRLRIEGDSGDDTWAGRAYSILDLSMLDLGETYSGSLDSSTNDLRLSFSLVHPDMSKWVFGLTLFHGW